MEPPQVSGTIHTTSTATGISSSGPFLYKIGTIPLAEVAPFEAFAKEGVPGYDSSLDPETGALVIHDVPIFCECSRTKRDGTVLTFDDAWIANAMRDALQGQAEGYFAPMHVHHHLPGESPRRAGYFKATRVGQITLEGRTRTAIFADLYVTDESVAFEIHKGQLPYRSVEIMRESIAKIDSLALLDHMPPYLQLPMLMLRDRQKASAIGDFRFEAGGILSEWHPSEPMLAVFQRADGAVNCLLSGEARAMKEPNQPELFQDTGGDAGDQKDKKKPDSGGDKQDMQAEGIDVPKLCKAIESGEITTAEYDAIKQALINYEMSRAQEAAPAASPTDGGEMYERQDHEEKSPREAALEGRLYAMEQKEIEREARQRRKDDVAAALERLRDRQLGADLPETLSKYHESYGPEAFAGYVEAIEKAAAPLDGDDPSALIAAGQRMHGNVPDVAMQYQDQGVDAVERASKFAREWAELAEHGVASRKLEDYVRINMKRPRRA